jgi:hypothetical protein
LLRFVAVETESDLEALAAERQKYGTFIAGIVFLNTEDSQLAQRNKRDLENSTDEVEIPKRVQYKIRMDIDSVESTLEIMTL